MKDQAAKKIVCFGEVIMRLSPEGHKLVQQTGQMDYFFGGTELNVGVSLAVLGENVQQVSAVSDDFIGEAAVQFINKFGIQTGHVQRNQHPNGLYFLEVGADVRPSRISYNRLNAAFANIDANAIAWKEILKDADFFHWTGITPAISENAYQALKKGLEVANELGVTITADPAYRSNLWKYGREGRSVLKELVQLSHIFIGGVNEINEILGTDFGYSDDDFSEASKTLIEQCASIKKVFDKVRTSLNASWQKIYGRAWNGESLITTSEFEITHIVDRIGTGDAFAAGVIYGLGHFDDEKTLQFGNAACVLKHSIYGDANLSGKQDILDLIGGNTGGRIKR
ncbi:sugar kinase [Christiangramia flava]|uniref:2-dehydro-3-deoxygluconate kinase n=1 Tax=Christiangramia flava JLT2011 TaxID=1229726 RepID=A0A1L7I5J5_9FLAO|nr:sugar kinase [Christiangramia flava]APU68889.1 2-dehydro-3-deoxygluconate kinase [Christiangramia flava JLT2011]OSS38965.1 2-dehydro-3-deoxygluconate kinase [Christiangramia flava JLT2011]